MKVIIDLMSSIWCDRTFKKFEILNDAKNDLIKFDRILKNIETLNDAKNDLILI